MFQSGLVQYFKTKYLKAALLVCTSAFGIFLFFIHITLVRGQYQLSSFNLLDVIARRYTAMNTNFTSKSSLTEDSMPFKTLDKTKKPPVNVMRGAVHVDTWSDISGYLVDDLRRDRRFPDNPTESSVIEKASLEYYQDKANFSARLYGYLLPSTSGDYKFGILSSNTSELWMSIDKDPNKLHKIACFGCIDQEHLPPKILPPKPNTFVKVLNFSQLESVSTSHQMKLQKDMLYYFEVYLKSRESPGFVSVRWMVGSSTTWDIISFNNLGTLENLHESLASLQLPSYHLQQPLKVKYIGDEIIDSVVLEYVLPHCDYQPMYAYKHKVLRYKGYLEVQHTAVFPDDHTLYKHGEKWSQGNPQIDAKRIQFVKDEYMNALNRSRHGNRFSHLQLTMLEENVNRLHTRHDGWRYLFEAYIYWKDDKEPTHISEYVYSSEMDPSKKLCSVKDHQWERKSKVHIVIPVKNQRKWVIHVVKNLEDIYSTTGDTNFTLILIDYESTDVNITSVIEQSRLPKHMLKLIMLKGPFSRAQGIQTGLDSVKSPNDIILSMDLHITMPSGFIEAIRKHTIKGRMGYDPAVVRLGPNYTENNINGFWEMVGYGLVALYKSDWDVIGGMDTKQFTTKWGGEDWEFMDRFQSHGYELFRHRYPGFVHYYHSRQGMWR